MKKTPNISLMEDSKERDQRNTKETETKLGSSCKTSYFGG
jgi:hypothetical protein